MSSSLELTQPLPLLPTSSSSTKHSHSDDNHHTSDQTSNHHTSNHHSNHHSTLDSPINGGHGTSIAESLIRRLTKPPTLYHISILPKDAPTTTATTSTPHTLSDAAYAGFVSSLPSTGYALPRRIVEQRRMFDTVVPWWLQWPLLFSGYTADAHVQRATAIVYLALSIVAIVWRNSPWLWYVVAGMTADAGLRVVGGDRLAVFSCMCEWVTTFIPGTYTIASAPRQFAWLLYTAILFVANFVTGYVLDDGQDDNHVGFAVLLGVLAGFQALELVGVSLPGLVFERVLVGCGLVSDVYVHKAEWIEAEKRLKMATAKAKMALGGQALHSVIVTNADRSQTLLRYDGLVLAARTKLDVIRNLSIGYVFPLLGVAGITDMYYYGYLFAGINEYVWRALAVCLGFLYLSFWIVQLVRAWLIPQVLLRELRHPHLRYSFMLILGVLLLSIDFMSEVSVEYTHVILWLCGPLVLVATLIFVHDWIQQPTTFDVFNASWLIGIIIMMVTAFEVPIAYPDLAELAWLWLAFGLFMWFIIMILVFARLFFGAPLPDSQRPTLFLMMSTCAIACAAILYQNPQAINQLQGPIGIAAEFLFWLTNFLALLCYFLLARAYFCRSPFNMSYWAISFPSAALALVWLFYWKIGNCDQATPPTQYSSEERCTNNQDSHTIRGVVILCFVNASLGNTILFANTILAALQRRLFLPMPQWSPAVALQLHHFAFRTALYKAAITIGQLAPTGTAAAAPSPRRSLYRHRLTSPELGLSATCPCRACSVHDAEAVECGERASERLTELLDHLATFDVALCTYVDNKRNALWPAVEMWLPQVHIEHTDGSQLHEVRLKLHRLIGDLASLQPILNNDTTTNPQLTTAITHCTNQLSDIARLIHLHLDHEEVLLTPLLHRFTDLPAANRIMRTVWEQTPTGRNRLIIPWLLNHLPDHPQRMAYVDCYSFATDNALSIMGRWMREGLDPFLYRQLCVDYPRLNSGEPSIYAKFW